MSDEEIFDVIVIGAGISGLYAAYRIQQKAPQLKVLVLEAKGKEPSSVALSFLLRDSSIQIESVDAH